MHFQLQKSHKASKCRFYPFSFARAHEFFYVEIPKKTVKIFHGRPLRPKKLNHFVPREKLHFKVQMSSKEGKEIFLSIFARYIPMILFYSRIPKQNCQKFSWTSVKTSKMEPVRLARKNNAFSSSNESKASKEKFYQFSSTIPRGFFYPKISK